MEKIRIHATLSLCLFFFLFWTLIVIAPHNIYGASEPTTTSTSTRHTKILIKMLSSTLTSNTNTHSNARYLAIYFKNDPDWHTYWKNPGDAGTPFSFLFFLNNKEYPLPALEWPIPKRFLVDDLLAYGYNDTYAFFFEWPTPDLLSTQEKNSFAIKIDWLACKERCIPESITIPLTLKHGELEFPLPPEATEFQVPSEMEQVYFKEIPESGPFPDDLIHLSLFKAQDEIYLTYNFAIDPKLINLDNNVLTPFPLNEFTFGKEQLFFDHSHKVYGLMKLNWEGDYLTPSVSLPTDGKFPSPYTFKFLYHNALNNQTTVVSKELSSFELLPSIPLSKDFLSISKFKVADNTDNAENTDKTKSEEPLSFWIYLLLGLLGGLILNIMPCVLPVICLKLFGLIQISKASHKEIVKHNILYSLGVWASFTVLASTILVLKFMGEEVGWGMHLGSPSFIIIMTIILFIFSLNFFGLFEFSTPGGNKIGGAKFTGNLEEFFNGVLTTILATPCSAPFLGTALTFAFSAPWWASYLIFWSVALGLSLPFLLTAAFPQTLAILPRPGLWMDHLKKFLGLGFLITILWCFSILMELELASAIDALLELILVLVFIFFAIFFHQRIGKKKNFITFFYLLPLALALHLYSTIFIPSSSPSTSSTTNIEQKDQVWEKWSPDTMARYSTEGRTLFIDFTAKWCLTCKANERFILETKDFRDLTLKHNLVLLKGDWTNHDPIIGKWLKEQGVVGVPAYFIQTADNRLIKLGELITIEKIKEHLE